MTVKKEPSGRRSIQLEVEVPGTPEEVWQAIATGPGISCWLVPADFEMRDGKPVSLKFNFGPGMESTCEVTQWRPPHMWASKAEGWAPGAPPIASEWSVEARAGGTCVFRIVQSLIAQTDDWDHQLEGAAYGMPGFLRTLQLYLAHFRNTRSKVMKWMVPVAGSEDQAWEALISALGVRDMSPGCPASTRDDCPGFSGVVEHLTRKPYDALIRLDKPCPGIAALGAFGCGERLSMAALNLYLYGEQAEDVVRQEQPKWDTWFQSRFPTPQEPA